MEGKRKELIASLLTATIFAIGGYFIKNQACSDVVSSGIPCWYWNTSFYACLFIGLWYLIRDKSRNEKEWFQDVVSVVGLLTVIALTAPLVITLPFLPLAIWIWVLFQHTVISFLLTIAFIVLVARMTRK